MRYDQAVMLRRPKILYVSQDAGTVDSHLSATLAAAQFDIDRINDFTSGDLTPYQLIIFNNWDLEAILPGRKEELEKYVKQGGGLLVIGGERNVYAEGKKEEDALDRTLPAKLAPPRSPEGTAVMLIIDKSSSMEGRKIELARLAAIGVVDNLRPIDQVGVLIFDNSFQWAVPLRRAEDRPLIKRLISGITPDGGTQISPALNEAFRKILPAECDVQTHCAADGWNFGRGRQPGSFARGAAEESDDFDGRAGAGCESGVSGEGRAVRGRKIVFPE